MTELAKEVMVPMRLVNSALEEMTEAVNRGWSDRDWLVATLLQVSARAGGTRLILGFQMLKSRRYRIAFDACEERSRMIGRERMTTLVTGGAGFLGRRGRLPRRKRRRRGEPGRDGSSSGIRTIRPSGWSGPTRPSSTT